jgi:hypothetical protein
MFTVVLLPSNLLILLKGSLRGATTINIKISHNLSTHLTVATLVVRNADEAMVGSGGVRRSVSCWCVWQESGFSRREDVFTFHLLIKKCYNF